MRIRAGRAPELVIRDADLSRGPGYVCALDEEAEIRVWIVEFQVRPPWNPWGNNPKGYIGGRTLGEASLHSPSPLPLKQSNDSFEESAAFDWEYRWILDKPGRSIGLKKKWKCSSAHDGIVYEDKILPHVEESFGFRKKEWIINLIDVDYNVRIASIDFKTRIGRIKNFFKFSIENCNCCNRILNNFVTCINIYPTVRES